MKKRMLALAIILILVLTSTVFAYAEGQTRDTNLVSFATNRTSRTSAIATVDITFSTVVDQYSVAIYLQKKVDNRWVSDVANPDYIYYKTGQNDFEYSFEHVYSSLESGTIYRLKCVSNDSVGSNSYSFTSYSNQF